MLGGVVPVDLVAPGGIVAFAIFLILTGRLVPRSTLDDVRGQRDAWQRVAEEASDQNRQLIEVARVINDVMSSLPTTGRVQ